MRAAMSRACSAKVLIHLNTASSLRRIFTAVQRFVALSLIDEGEKRCRTP
jgi:hypothetical protein